MKCSIYFFTLLFLVFNSQLKAQKDSLDSLTGIFKTYINPSLEFIIKKDGKQLVLEIVGQGQLNMLGDVNEGFHFREIPMLVKFNRNTAGKALGFHWIQKKAGQAEWIKLPGEDQTAITGRYRLTNDVYNSIYVTNEGKLTVRVIDGPELPLIDSGGNFQVKDGDYTIWYEFKKDNEGHFSKMITREGGSLEFRRVKDYDVSFDGGFSRPNGFTRADTLRGMLTPLRTCYDVNFYTLDVEVFPYKKFIKGQNSIRFKALESFDRMQIDLYENMKIEKIMYHSKELSYSREYNAVFIQLPELIAKGAEESITVYYEGKPIIPNIAELKGGFLWYQDHDGNPWIESVCQGSGASLWWPCKDHLSDEPDSMKISVTIPDNLVDISNGKLLDTTSLPGNRKRFDWFVSYPINNYNVAVNIGNYKHFSDRFARDKDTTQLHFYYLPYNLEPAKKIFGRTKELLSFFERSFGGYPFKKDGFTLMESLYPMEHQGAVSIGSINNPFRSNKIDYNELIRTMWHEAAHEWWGNSITGKDIADIWIHEAFATYTEAMVMEFFDGKVAMQKSLHGQVPGNNEPIIGSYGVNDFRLGDVYPKGCMMLHTLRSIIDNDSTWFNLLRGLQRHFRYQTVTSEDIVDYINKALGKNLTSFFDQYLRHAAIPELQLKFTQNKDQLEVQYRWKTDVKDFNMPVKVTTTKSGFDFIYPESDWKVITLNGMKQKNFKVDIDGFLIKVSVH
ncbi:MAG: M1 family metallopeptidase [Chitinophagaceae bacterium]